MEHRINQELIRAMRAQLHDDPGSWVQNRWVTNLAEMNPETVAHPVYDCGTAYCAAGWTLALTGFTITVENEWVPLAHIRKITGLDNAQILKNLKIKAPRTAIPEPEIHVADAAEIILGLEGIEIRDPRPHMLSMEIKGAAHFLFAGGNNLADIDAVITAAYTAAGIEN